MEEETVDFTYVPNAEVRCLSVLVDSNLSRKWARQKWFQKDVKGFLFLCFNERFRRNW